MKQTPNMNREQKRKLSPYPSSVLLLSACQDDYKDTLDRYDKIYDRINIALGFCGVILVPTLTSFDYRLISHLIDTRSFILFLLSSVSIISVITALIQLLRLMKTMTLRVFDSTIIRNKAIYCHPEEESALFLIYAYTNATVELEKRISEKQKKYDSVIWKLIASLLAYAAFILLQKGL